MSTPGSSDIEAATEKTPTNKHSSTKQYVNGLRGLAALIVYLSHNVPWWYGTDHPIQHGFGYRDEYMLATFPFIRSFFTGGAAAVALFFVMSGYVLSSTPLAMVSEGKVDEMRRYLLAAAVRRPFRLFMPVAAISLIFAVCMHLPFGLAPHLSWPEPKETLVQELRKWVVEMGWTMNLFVEHGQFTHWFPYDPPAWTMAAELRGSLLVFAFLAGTARLQPRIRHLSCMGMGAVLLFIYQWELAAFMFGTAIAMLKTRAIPHDSSILRVLNCGLLVAGWYILGQPHGTREPELSCLTPGWYLLTMVTPPNYFNNEFWRFWNVIGATMLFYAVTRIDWLQEAFDRPPMRFLGKVSFSLYLIHIPIAWTIGDRICRIFGVIRQDFTTPFDGWLKLPDIGPVGFSTGLLVWQALILPLNLWLATLATNWIDEPSVQFGKLLSARFLR